MKVKVEIRKSTIPNAGNGVFATEDIKKGEYVCYYDGEDIQVEDVDICTTDMSYALNSYDNKTIKFGYYIPKSNDGIAQIMNDSICPIFTNENDYKMVVEDLIKYEKESIKNVNCLSDGKSYKFIAIKNIAKGSELFYHYGPRYWMLKLLKESTNSFFRLIIYSTLINTDFTKIDEKESFNILKNVMNQDLNNYYWIEVFKNNSPIDYLLQIIKQCNIPTI